MVRAPLIQKLVVAVLGLTLALLFSVTARAQPPVTELGPDTTTDPGIWFESDVRPGGSASIVLLSGLGGDLENNQPSGPSATLLTTDFTNAAKAEVAVLGDYGAPADVFPTLNLSYAFYKAPNAGQNLFAAAAIKVNFFNPVCDDVASAGDCFMTLVYEPYLNGPAPTLSTWTTVNIDSTTGLFWSDGGFGTANSAGGPPLRTLNDWLGVLSSDFADAQLQAISVGVGSFNQGQIAYFDDVQVSHGFAGGLAQRFDFETAPSEPAAVPLPHAALLLLAVLLAGIGGAALAGRRSDHA